MSEDRGGQLRHVYHRAQQRQTQRSENLCLFSIGKGNENFVNSSSSPAEIANVKVFLSEFLAYTKEFAVEQNISQTKEAIKKLDKEHKSLNKKQEKYQKSINKTNKKKEKPIRSRKSSC